MQDKAVGADEDGKLLSAANKSNHDTISEETCACTVDTQPQQQEEITKAALEGEQMPDMFLGLVEGRHSLSVC